MARTSSSDTSDSIFSILDRERLAIWRTHPDWPEERRLKAWSQRQAEIASYLFDDNSTPRQLRKELGGSTLSQALDADQGRIAIDIPGVRNRDLQALHTASAVPMSRSNTSKSSYLSNMSSPSSSDLHQVSNSTGYRTHPRTADGYSASYTYSTANWLSTGGFPQQQQSDEFVFDPADYFLQLDNSFDNAQYTAEKQRVEGFRPSSLPSHPYNVSPSTSMSSNLSSHGFTTTSEDMSRQSSTTSSSVADAVGMLRVCSSFSACSDNVPFSLDEEDEQLDASFFSCTTEKPTSSSPTTTSCDDSNLFSNVGHGAVGLQQHFFYETSPIITMTVGQGDDQEMAVPERQGEDMVRAASMQSTSSISSAEIKANQRRQKQIENGKRPIASKTSPDGPTSNNSKQLSKLRPLRAEEPGSRRKEPIAKQNYVRPQHPKLKCDLCEEFPGGFRGEHELRRHHDRAHAPRRKVWICVDPHTETAEGWRPQLPLEICKQCKLQKPYNVYYNAAAHLRRTHFFPRKRGRRARGEERESRAGKAGGNFPPIDWLKANGFLMEIEVKAGSQSQAQGDSYADDVDEDYDDFDYLPQDSALELHHDNLTADALGLQTYPLATDLSFSYSTEDLDCAMQWSASDFPQAPAMEYTMSAPPVMMTIPDQHGLYMPNDMILTTDARF